jgi:hypothetical protein
MYFFFDPETSSSTGVLYQDDYHKGNQTVSENVLNYTYSKKSKCFEILIESNKDDSFNTNLVIYSPLTKITKISVDGKKYDFGKSESNYSFSSVKGKNKKAKIKVWYK